MKAGIVFDTWKRAVFVAHLDGAGFTYAPMSDVPAGTLGFQVITDDLEALGRVVKAANAEAATTKRGHPDSN